ncbi:MAG: hypothetical protein JSR79_08105 [Proteobacteria bacterium]|nr:hypothetical protein [Pseudomonadota bacterium]
MRRVEKLAAHTDTQTLANANSLFDQFVRVTARRFERLIERSRDRADADAFDRSFRLRRSAGRRFAKAPAAPQDEQQVGGAVEWNLIFSLLAKHPVGNRAAAQLHFQHQADDLPNGRRRIGQPSNLRY